ncbi:MAG: hypothetical protein OEX14_02625 [Paracoccaceae bacterium]|nr:hypothetical protein [Paracoccaceae bacterium]
MPSTYTTSLTLEKQATGENDNAWGTALNAALDDIDTAVAGRLGKSVAGAADITLTAAESLHAVHEYTGALTGNIAVVVPTAEKVYFAYNNTSGSFSLTVKTASGTGVAIPQGGKAVLYCDGTNISKVVAPTVFMDTLLDGADAATARTTLGLGTAAVADTGVANGNVPVMDATGYPAADGSRITSVAAPLRGHIDGLVLSNNTVDPLMDIDIAAGEATDAGQNVIMSLSAVLTKRLDAAWAVGTNQGGLDTGVVAADLWYYVWLIRRSDTGVVDGLFSLSPTAPTMPTNYDQKRRIGAVFTGSGQIRTFKQRGSMFAWMDRPFRVSSTLNPGVTAFLETLYVPDGISVMANVGVFTDSGSSVGLTENVMTVTSPEHDDAFPDIAGAFLRVPSSSRESTLNIANLNLWVWTSTGQIRLRAGASAATYQVHLMSYGWMDPRGRDE